MGFGNHVDVFGNPPSSYKICKTGVPELREYCNGPAKISSGSKATKKADVLEAIHQHYERRGVVAPHDALIGHSAEPIAAPSAVDRSQSAAGGPKKRSRPEEGAEHGTPRGRRAQSNQRKPEAEDNPVADDAEGSVNDNGTMSEIVRHAQGAVIARNKKGKNDPKDPLFDAQSETGEQQEGRPKPAQVKKTGLQIAAALVLHEAALAAEDVCQTYRIELKSIGSNSNLSNRNRRLETDRFELESIGSNSNLSNRNRRFETDRFELESIGSSSNL